MRYYALSITLSLGAVLMLASAPATANPQSAQSRACYEKATKQKLYGKRRAAFHQACMKGSMSAERPAAQNAPSKEAQAITAPSGADRSLRSRQCSDEADRRRLAGGDRNAFRLSCMATAGPVTEAQTKDQPPKPANAIPGIGVNANKPPS